MPFSTSRFLFPAVGAFLVAFAPGTASAASAQPLPNSIGMELITIPGGHFHMGEAAGAKWMEGGEWDESPVHEVEISRPFSMSATEVTNAQYERFDPKHRTLRGKEGFSKADDEPVLFVSWNEAVAFCAWLGKKENKPYRLPTEAEWEYACRAGTTTPYSTGAKLPSIYYRAQADYVDHRTSHKTPVSLLVKQSPANAWGLYDMHGNAEEWCQDWYGPYEKKTAVDPVGRITGYARVTRGGSHNTDVYYLRSANRLSALPEDRTCYIGFRVVQAPAPTTEPLPPPAPALVMSNVAQERAAFTSVPADSAKPYFVGPRPYVLVPEDAKGPLFWFHDHDPAITYCDNGDLLAIWFSTEREWGRELAIAGSRLRHGSTHWEPASIFFDLADRNDHAPALWRDDHGRLYHFNATGIGGWDGLATIMRTSDDNGSTWTAPRFIKPEHSGPNGCVESVIKTSDGRIMVPVDGDHATELLVSTDDTQSWVNPAAGQPADKYVEGGSGHRIAGIHAALVQLKNGNLFALGRGADIGGHMAQSVSNDLGKTWKYSASEFPPIRAGQRLVMKRLREGPLLVITFTDMVVKHAPFELGVQRARTLSGKGIDVVDAAGKTRRVYGMFASLSFDEGKTWPVKKLVTPGGKPKEYFGHGWTKKFTTDDTHAEPMGYLAATQTPDGHVQLISSGLHYEFNLAWLQERMPAAKQ
jgi:formylglycine-generating enzyme required for sulfatase activity